MRTTATFDFAGITYALESEFDLHALHIYDRYRTFQTAECAAPDVRIHWHNRASTCVPGALLFDAGRIWRVHRHPEHDGFVVTCNYPDYTQRGFALTATMQANATWTDCLIEEPAVPTPWTSMLNYGLGELLLRARIVYHQGMVCHASGLDAGGRGILFSGHAGAGKSTQLQLWAQESGVTPLNDDRVALRLLPEGPILYGTPWGGTAQIARNHRVPLHAIILLEQAPENALTRISALEAAPLLLPRLFLPFWDQALLHQLLTTLDRVLAVTPIYRLRNRADRDCVAMVRELLAQG